MQQTNRSLYSADAEAIIFKCNEVIRNWVGSGQNYTQDNLKSTFNGLLKHLLVKICGDSIKAKKFFSQHYPLIKMDGSRIISVYFGYKTDNEHSLYKLICKLFSFSGNDNLSMTSIIKINEMLYGESSEKVLPSITTNLVSFETIENIKF